MSFGEIVDAQIKPFAESAGYRLTRTVQVLGVEGLWNRLFRAMPSMGRRRAVQALATEWESADGSRSMIVVVTTSTQDQQSIVWQMMTTELEAPVAVYESVRDAYLYAIGNTELNPEWIAASNRSLVQSTREIRRFWDNATEVSRAAHQQRMQAISQRGAGTRSLGDTYSDILDISHRGYLTRDQMNSAGHSSAVRSVAGTTLIGNHETGEHYTVDGMNRYYWVNQDGVYVGTDNALSDPRLNERTRDAEWTRFQPEG